MQSTNREIGVGAAPYILMIVILGPLLYLLINTKDFTAGIIFIGIAVLFLYYINHSKIHIFDDKLIFKRRTMSFLDIKKATINFNPQARTPSNKRIPPYGICFFGASSEKEPLLMIPSKLYGKKDLIYLMHTLIKKNPNIQFDKWCQDLSAGDFGSLEKMGIKKILPWIIWIMVVGGFLEILFALSNKYFK